MGYKKIALGILIWAAAFTSTSAHTLYLNSGRVVVGRIIAQTRTHVTIQAGGQNQVFNKQEIREISYSDPVIVQPKKEEKKIETKPAETPDNRWSILLRSAALPGWGHFQAGEPAFGFMYAGAFVASLSYVGAKTRAFQRTEKQYDEKLLVTFMVVFNATQGNPQTAFLANFFASSAYYKPFEKAANDANASLIALGTVFTFNLLHAYYTGMQLEKKTAWHWEWGVAPDEKKGYSAAARFVVCY